MLVLSRQVGEEIVIGENIRVMIVRVQGHKVRVGIVAPESINVCRAELQPGNSQDGNRKQRIAKRKRDQ